MKKTLSLILAAVIALMPFMALTATNSAKAYVNVYGRKLRLTDHIEAGKTYAIVSMNEVGSAYMLTTALSGSSVFAKQVNVCADENGLFLGGDPANNHYDGTNGYVSQESLWMAEETDMTNELLGQSAIVLRGYNRRYLGSAGLTFRTWNKVTSASPIFYQAGMPMNVVNGYLTKFVTYNSDNGFELSNDSTNSVYLFEYVFGE